MRVLFACIVVMASCTDHKNASPDAHEVDAPPGGTCTGATYDPCTIGVDGECMSNLCHFYMQSNITVCTTTCSASMPCPNDSAGNAVACNMMGNCKPAVANNCTR